MIGPSIELVSNFLAAELNITASMVNADPAARKDDHAIRIELA